MREEISAYKRDRILEEAVKLFYERGFSGTTLDDIAGKLGVTKPFIYTHFRSKVESLVVDMEHFYRNFRAILPYFISTSPKPARERLQSQHEQEQIDEAARCILCGCCTSSCPSYWKNDSYLGPAALLKAWRFLGDSRDDAKAERIDAVNGSDGVWRCHTIFNCKEACPKDIDIPAALSRLKRAVVSGSVA